VRGRKPNPANLRAVREDERNGGKTTTVRPPRRPRCPTVLTEAQEREYRAICREIRDLGWLDSADRNVIASLAIAMDKLLRMTEYLNLNGEYYWVETEGRAQKCPACGGKAGVTDLQCRACKGKGIIRGPRRRERHKAPEVMEQRYAQDLVLKYSAALGLDPTSRVRLKAPVAKGQKQQKAPGGLKAFLGG
jgi:P27 family predicted phage terminase small subunit